MWRNESGQIRANGDNLRRVNFLVDDVVVLLHLGEVARVAETRGLEEVAQVAPQIRHLRDLVSARLEVGVVDGIEANKRGKQPDVCLCDVFTHEVAAIRQALL